MDRNIKDLSHISCTPKKKKKKKKTLSSNTIKNLSHRLIKKLDRWVRILSEQCRFPMMEGCTKQVITS